ncbi:hypothetical protein HY969_04000 [Candidatus Kaiserbacteria bacterium]|nr:hypothetical protein [Candidatus Kaiserbacteria bacterium]
MRKAFGTLVFVAAFAVPIVASAATMRIAPASASAVSGGSVSVSVQVTSSDQAMNAASGVLKFPPDLLQVSSISKSGSIIGLWAQEPSHSNIAGTVNFEGVVLNPGFIGSNGTVLTVTFRALVAGVASLSISSGSVLANDGNGTEVLTGSLPGFVLISEGVAVAPSASPNPSPTSQTSSVERIVITSPTHPDPAKAYRAQLVRLEWKNPRGTGTTRVLYDRNPSSIPSVIYDPPITSKEISPGNGTWYFHAQARTDSGWGPVAHFKFTIDPNAPEETTVATSSKKDLLDISVTIAKEEPLSPWERTKAIAIAVFWLMASQWPSALVALFAYAIIRYRRMKRISSRFH